MSVEVCNIQEQVSDLIAFGKKRFPKVDFQDLEQQKDVKRAEGPKLGDEAWKVPESKVERPGGDQWRDGNVPAVQLFGNRDESRQFIVTLFETPEASGRGS